MNNQKIMIISIVVVLLGVGGYLYFSGEIKKPSEISTNGLVSSNTGTNPISLNETTDVSVATNTTTKGSEIAQMLKNINAIRLDNRIIANPSFAMLVDSSLLLPSVSVTGRLNPFGGSTLINTNAIVNTINVPTTNTPPVAI